MPLIISPIDGSPMKQINRFGIELDVCPTSGGVWLDRGELEKLISLLKEADHEQDHISHAPARHTHAPQHHHGYKHDDDDDYKYKHGKKKTGIQKVMDIFDF
jgi:Zn-finger nucleic acid-binding protein